MATKKTTKRQLPVKPRKPAKKVAGELVVKLDGNTVMKLLGNLTASIERSNDVIAGIGRQHATGTEAIPENANCATMAGGAAPPAPLASIEELAFDLSHKCRSMYGFSCNLREQVQQGCPPLEEDFKIEQHGVKGLLDLAIRVLDATYSNMISTRNTIT